VRERKREKEGMKEGGEKEGGEKEGRGRGRGRRREGRSGEGILVLRGKFPHMDLTDFRIGSSHKYLALTCLRGFSIWSE